MAAGRELHFLLDGDRRRVIIGCSRIAASSARSGSSTRWRFWASAICRSRPRGGCVVHRLHHQHSDHEPDPHTPLVSWFWGHVGWLFIENRETTSAETYHKYARDILSDPFYMRLERNSDVLLGLRASRRAVLRRRTGRRLLAATARWPAAIRSACNGCCGASSIARSSRGT